MLGVSLTVATSLSGEVRVGCLRVCEKEKQSVRNLMLKLKHILFPQKILKIRYPLKQQHKIYNSFSKVEALI